GETFVQDARGAKKSQRVSTTIMCKAGRDPPHTARLLNFFCVSRILGRVLSVFPPVQLFSRQIAAAWSLFPSPVAGWTSSGRLEILLLPEPRLPGRRPTGECPVGGGNRE